MLMDIIKARHSIRNYTDEQIRRDDLEKILEAGNYAPNAGGGQRSMMENMILQATELGIASCIISRGYETFDSERKKTDERMGSAGRIRMPGIYYIRIYRWRTAEK